MQKIIPNLWFDKQAEEAVNFYAAIFENSKIGDVSRYGEVGQEVHGMEAGTVMTVEFELEDQKFLALNGGPDFKFNPSISFLVSCETKDEVDMLWKKLFSGGTALMDLGSYPFSEKYGWLQDKYGLSWQLMFMGDTKIKQKIIPTLMFVGEACGKAEEAINFYVSVFSKSKVGDIMRYGKNEDFDKEGTIKHAAFTLDGQEFMAMDSAYNHNFSFNEAISFIVNCKNQKEVDYFWGSLSEGGDPKAQVCGWVKDKYGLSWQIVPDVLDKMMKDRDPKKIEKVMEAFLKMKKIDIDSLKRAYE